MLGCGGADPAPIQPAPIAAAGEDATPRDAPPRLATDREQFWARYVGTTGEPGPAMLDFCRTAKHDDHVVDVAPGVRLVSLSAFGDCQLIVEGQSVREVVKVLDRWSPYDKDSFADQRHHLMAYISTYDQGPLVRDFEKPPQALNVTWATYLPLEDVRGTDGRLLAGFDPKQVLRKPATELRTAARAPFLVETDCSASACAAYAPRFQGGGPIRIGMLHDSLAISFGVSAELVVRANELIARSLGRGRPDSSGGRVYRRDGVRYVVHERDLPTFSIGISLDR